MLTIAGDRQRLCDGITRRRFLTIGYYNLGIDPETTQLVDPRDRPQYLLEHREPIRELI